MLKRFNGVEVGKLTGQLHLKLDEIVWKVQNNSTNIHVNYKNIVKHMVAGRGDSFLLKIITEENKSHIFIFNNIDDREAARSHLNSILCPVPSVPQKINENNETQQKILDCNSSLRVLYDELVPSILNHNEFWESRGELLQNEINLKKENQATTGGDKVTTSTRKHQFKVTPAFIEETFKKNPTLQTAYNKQVPLLMTEHQFWSKYFQSQFLFQPRAGMDTSTEKERKDKGGKDNNNISISWEQRDTVVISQDLYDPTVDLRNNNEFHNDISDDLLSARQYKFSKKYAQRQELIRKYNAHAANLVSQIVEIDDDNDEINSNSNLLSARNVINNNNNNANNKRKRSDNDDNSMTKEVNASAIKFEPDESLLRTRKKFASVSRLDDLVGSDDDHLVDMVVTEPQIKKEKLDRPQSLQNASLDNIKKFMVSSVSKITFWDPSQNNNKKEKKNIEKFDEKNLTQMKDIYNEIYARRNDFVDEPDAEDEIHKLYASVTELLRHYWAAVLRKDNDKIKRLRPSLSKYLQQLELANIERKKEDEMMFDYSYLVNSLKEALQRQST
jgi:hypothetical protein